jgi:type VI secretion system protein
MNTHSLRKTLNLTVNRIAGSVPQQPLTASFDEQGGTIGRREDNDWVLPDQERFISSRHALISFDEGQFFITDVSSNGVFLNQADTPLGSDIRAPLQQGDTLTIGEYEIGVSLHEQALSSADSSFDSLDDPFARLLDENAGMRLEQNLPPFETALDTAESESVFTLDEPVAPNLEAESPSGPIAPASVTSESDHISDLNAYFDQPSLIPEDWQAEQESPEAETHSAAHLVSEPLAQLSPKRQETHPHEPGGGMVTEPHFEQTGAISPAAGTPPLATTDQEALRDALAEGLGLSRSLLDEVPLPALLKNLGQIVRSSVEGAMSILRARAQMKSEFRMSQTMIRPVENNPLKFSVNTEEALRHIIDPRQNSGYLPPLAAFREAHDDSEAHMLAVMVGMQSALKAVLQRFKPENLEKRLGPSALLEKVPLYRQAKSWERFTELYGEIANEVEDDFQQLFGRAFSQAYEAQIRRLDSIKHTNNETTTQDRY